MRFDEVLIMWDLRKDFILRSDYGDSGPFCKCVVFLFYHKQDYVSMMYH